MFDSELWRVDMREISKERPTLCAKGIQHQIIRDSHSVQMKHGLALKSKSTSLMIDGAKRGDNHLCIGVANSAQTPYFIDLLNFESSDSITVTRRNTPIIQKLSTDSIRVVSIVTAHAGNLVRALNPGESPKRFMFCQMKESHTCDAAATRRTWTLKILAEETPHF
jgi:hypothetical protein